MLYTVFTVGDKEYKLRATASSIIEIEKRLGGKNPLDILMAIEGGELPPVSSILYILHGSMQKFHSKTDLQRVMQIYDEYIEAGNTYMDIIKVLMDVFRVSGFFATAPKTEQEEETAEE